MWKANYTSGHWETSLTETAQPEYGQKLVFTVSHAAPALSPL